MISSSCKQCRSNIHLISACHHMASVRRIHLIPPVFRIFSISLHIPIRVFLHSSSACKNLRIRIDRFSQFNQVNQVSLRLHPHPRRFHGPRTAYLVNSTNHRYLKQIQQPRPISKTTSSTTYNDQISHKT
jgi:hypothetical protein